MSYQTKFDQIESDQSKPDQSNNQPLPQDGVKTFVASTLREALQEIRQKLGPDALILSQRQMGSRIAVEAALELPADNSEVDEVQPEEPGAALVAEVDVTTGVDIPTPALGANAPSSSERYRFEAVADNQTKEELRQLLAARFNYAHVPVARLAGAVRFVGAAGTGKSTTLIKVLSEWVRVHGPQEVVVITTDQEHLAGVEAVSLSCQMLNVKLHECAPHQLGEVLQTYTQKTLVLVDTPAMTVKTVPPKINGVKDIWVCSGLHSAANCTAQHEWVSALHPEGVVLTQLDQNATGDELGELLYLWRLPIYWLGIGSTLPGCLEMADREQVSTHLFKQQDQGGFQIAV